MWQKSQDRIVSCVARFFLALPANHGLQQPLLQKWLDHLPLKSDRFECLENHGLFSKTLVSHGQLLITDQ